MDSEGILALGVCRSIGEVVRRLRELKVQLGQLQGFRVRDEPALRCCGRCC